MRIARQLPEDFRVLVDFDEAATVGKIVVLEIEQEVAIGEEMGAVPGERLIAGIPLHMVGLGENAAEGDPPLVEFLSLLVDEPGTEAVFGVADDQGGAGRHPGRVVDGDRTCDRRHVVGEPLRRPPLRLQIGLPDAAQGFVGRTQLFGGKRPSLAATKP